MKRMAFIFVATLLAFEAHTQTTVSNFKNSELQRCIGAFEENLKENHSWFTRLVANSKIKQCLELELVKNSDVKVNPSGQLEGLRKMAKGLDQDSVAYSSALHFYLAKNLTYNECIEFSKLAIWDLNRNRISSICTALPAE